LDLLKVSLLSRHASRGLDDFLPLAVAHDDSADRAREGIGDGDGERFAGADGGTDLDRDEEEDEDGGGVCKRR
jgi:hypothetical protein